MLQMRILVAALMLWAGQAWAISFDCVPPVFPARQVSQEEQRRVVLQLRSWQACYAAFSARHRNIDATRQDHEVAIALEKWSASLRVPAAGAVQRASGAQPAVHARARR